MEETAGLQQGSLTKARNKTTCFHKKLKGHTSRDFRARDVLFRLQIPLSLKAFFITDKVEKIRNEKNRMESIVQNYPLLCFWSHQRVLSICLKS